MPTSSRSKSGIFPIAQPECSGLGENIKALVAIVVKDIEALQLTTFKSNLTYQKRFKSPFTLVWSRMAIGLLNNNNTCETKKSGSLTFP